MTRTWYLEPHFARILPKNRALMMKSTLAYYKPLNFGRDFYLAVAEKVLENCDLVVDGTLSTEQMSDKIIEAIHKTSV